MFHRQGISGYDLILLQKRGDGKQAIKICLVMLFKTENKHHW